MTARSDAVCTLLAAADTMRTRQLRLPAADSAPTEAGASAHLVGIRAHGENTSTLSFSDAGKKNSIINQPQTNNFY